MSLSHWSFYSRRLTSRALNTPSNEAYNTEVSRSKPNAESVSGAHSVRWVIVSVLPARSLQIKRILDVFVCGPVAQMVSVRRVLSVIWTEYVLCVPPTAC